MAISRIADLLHAGIALLLRRHPDPEDLAVGGGDPILALRGTGTLVWSGEDADSYVCRLRESWL